MNIIIIICYYLLLSIIIYYYYYLLLLFIINIRGMVSHSRRSQTSRLPANENSVRNRMGTKQRWKYLYRRYAKPTKNNSGSIENNTSVIVLSKTKTKLKLSLPSSCCNLYFRLGPTGPKIREVNGENGGCEYDVVRSTPHSLSYLPVCALELQLSMRLAFWDSPPPSNSPYICTSYLRHLFTPRVIDPLIR